MGLIFVFVFDLWLVSWLRAPVDILFCNLLGVLVHDSFPKSFLCITICMLKTKHVLFSRILRGLVSKCCVHGWKITQLYFSFKSIRGYSNKGEHKCKILSGNETQSRKSLFLCFILAKSSATTHLSFMILLFSSFIKGQEEMWWWAWQLPPVCVGFPY